MIDTKKKVKVLCNYLNINMKELAKYSKVSYNTLVSINLGVRHPGSTTIRGIDNYVTKIKPGFKLNPFFFDEPNATPFVQNTEESAMAKPVTKIKVDDTKTINQRMVEARKKHGLSQGEFAKKLDCIKGTLQSIEYNRMVPNVELVRKLKHTGFIVSYDEFLDGTKSIDQEKLDELNQKILKKDLEIKELKDDIQMYKNMIKQKLS